MRFRKALRYGLAALALPLIGATARHASAEPITIGAVYAVVVGAYEAYQQLQGLVSSNSSLGSSILAATDAIYQELQLQQYVAWKTQALNGMYGFRNLQYRPLGYSSNDEDWEYAESEAATALTYYEVLVESGGNVDSLYAMAPTYAALLATHAGLVAMREDIYPGEPFNWNENNAHQASGIKTLNQLVGSSRYMCDPGENPGAGHYNDDYAWQGTEPTNYDSSSKSRFWPKLMNDYVTVGYWTGLRVVGVLNGTCQYRSETHPMRCSPGSSTCAPIKRTDLSTNLVDQQCTLLCCTGNVWPANSGEYLSGAETARGLGAYYYDTKEFVSLLRTTMKGILSIGGGNTGYDEASMSLPAYGRKVDPVTTESSCTHTGGLAYPMMDVPTPPNPVSFASGYFVQGDGYNIFPDQLVRISNNPAGKIARSNAFPIPGAGPYTLVVRYYQNNTVGQTAKVSFQSGNNGETLAVIGNNVSFPYTNGNWKLLRIDFATNVYWPSTAYARIEFKTGQVGYLDSVWLLER